MLDINHRVPIYWEPGRLGSVEGREPEMEGEEFFLLAVALQMKRRGRRRLEWTELRDTLTCSLDFRQPAMENLQRKGLIKKVGKRKDDKLYSITSAGEKLILGKKKDIVDNAVVNGPMKKKHGKVMKKVIEDRVLHIEHVWVDPHIVSEGMGGPDLTVTPVTRTGSFLCHKQYAVEVTKDPSTDQKRLVGHFENNRDNKTPTIFVPVYERKQLDVANVLEREYPDATPVFSEENFFRRPFNPETFCVETSYSVEKVDEKVNVSNLSKLRNMLKVDRKIIEMRRRELKKEPGERIPIHATRSGEIREEELALINEDRIIPQYQIRSGTGTDRQYHGIGTALSKDATDAKLEELDRFEETLKKWEKKTGMRRGGSSKGRPLEEKIRRALKKGKPSVRDGYLWIGSEKVCKYTPEAQKVLDETVYGR